MRPRRPPKGPRNDGPLQVSPAGLSRLVVPRTSRGPPLQPPWRRTGRQPVDHRSPTPHAKVIRRPPSRGPRPDQRSHPAGGRRPPRGRGHDRRRPRGVRMGAGPPARRPAHFEELHRAADRGRRARSRRAGDPVLRGRRALAVRGPDPGRDGLHQRRFDVGWLPGLEGRRPRFRDAGRPERRAEAALQPPPADPRGRIGRARRGCSVRRRCSSGPAASVRRPRSTSPRPVSGRSASSTSTSSTCATCSARSSTPPIGWGSARSNRRASRSTR